MDKVSGRVTQPPIPVLLGDERSLCFVQGAQLVGLVVGFRIGGSDPYISHLHYADDTIIFCKYDEFHLLSVFRILKFFQAVSSLKVNIAKSAIAGILVPEDRIVGLVNLIGCVKVTNLDLPMGGNPKSLSFWEPVIVRFRRKLSSWKKSFLWRQISSY